MDLHSCPNCTAVFGDVQDRCPMCGADAEGDGAEVELDGTARAAIADLGGVRGGILENGPESFVVWCERGAVRYDLDAGLRWRARTGGRVESVTVLTDGVRLQTARGSAEVDLETGEAR